MIKELKLALCLIYLISVVLGIFNIGAMTYAFNIKDIFNGMSTNYTRPGSYQDSAAGYYSGGGASMRTKSTAINPISITPPSISTNCSRIDAYTGSMSIISSGELVNLANNIGSEAAAYAFHLGMKTYAPQIENLMKDLRNLSMMLNQQGIGHCKMTQAAFATALPKDSAMRELVCEEMATSGGGDIFARRKICQKDLAKNQAIRDAQTRDPEMMLDNYNIFVKAAEKIRIPVDMYDSMMSMTGTIIVRNGQVIFLDSLAKDHKSWVTHLKGGESGSLYSCAGDRQCLSPTLRNNIAVTQQNSYQGKAKIRLDSLKAKLANNTAFGVDDTSFLSSIGEAFPIYNYITLEAVSGITIIDSSSELVASYVVLQHLEEVTGEIRKAVAMLEAKQIDDQHIKRYLNNLDKVQLFASEKWGQMLQGADVIESRAEKIERHLMAKERS